MSEPTASAEPTTDVQVEAPPEQPPIPPVDGGEGLLSGPLFSSIDELLGKLVPANDIVVKDCWGKETKLPSALPARRQIKVFRIFKEISEMPTLVSAFESEMNMDAGAIIDLIIQVASDEDVSNKLGEAFSTAHPDACEGDPLDVFPIEEILAGLIPFFIRFLHRGMGAMGALGVTPNA